MLAKCVRNSLRRQSSSGAFAQRMVFALRVMLSWRLTSTFVKVWSSHACKQKAAVSRSKFRPGDPDDVRPFYSRCCWCCDTLDLHTWYGTTCTYGMAHQSCGAICTPSSWLGWWQFKCCYVYVPQTSSETRVPTLSVAASKWNRCASESERLLSTRSKDRRIRNAECCYSYSVRNQL